MHRVDANEVILKIAFDSEIIEAIRCVTKEDGYDIKEYYQRIKK